MKKKNIVILFTVILLVVVIAIVAFWCVKKKDHGLNPKDPQSVMIWHYYNGAQVIEFE